MCDHVYVIEKIDEETEFHMCIECGHSVYRPTEKQRNSDAALFEELMQLRDALEDYFAEPCDHDFEMIGEKRMGVWEECRICGERRFEQYEEDMLQDNE